MEEELNTWKETVNVARSNFYELNNYTTLQLLTLRRELSDMIASEELSKSSNVKNLLWGISPHVTRENIYDVVKKVLSETQVMLKRVNSNVAYEDESAVRPQHHISSMQSDMPTLQEQDLTEEQMEILSYVIKGVNCSPYLVLKAFEECKELVMSREDYERWCANHIGSYNFCSDDNDSEHVLSLGLHKKEKELGMRSYNPACS